MSKVQLLDESFDPPAGLAPAADLETHLSLGWEYQVEVLVSAPLKDVALWISPTLGRLEPLSRTTTRLSGTTSNPCWCAHQLVRIRAPYRVVGGRELRATTRATAQRMLNAVTDSAVVVPGSAHLQAGQAGDGL